MKAGFHLMQTFTNKEEEQPVQMKKIIIALLALVMVISIVGCGSTPSSSSSSNSNSSSSSNEDDGGNVASGEVVELDFWDMVWGPPEYIDTAKKLVDKFNSEHPNIKVTYQSTPWNNWYQTFSTAIASNTAPDISTGAGYQAFQFYDMGEILPIDDVIEEWSAEGKLDDFFEGTIDTLKYDGHYVALPWGIDIRVPIYRKDILEAEGLQPPTTWDELRVVAKELSGNGRYGVVMPSDTGGTHYLYTFMINNGGGIFTEDRKVDFLNERNMEAAQFLADLVKDGSLNPAGAGFKGDDAEKSFTQGDAVFLIGNHDIMSPELEGKIAVLDPLSGPHGEQGTVRWVNNLMIYKQTKHPKEAKEFLKWWSENNTPLWTEGHTGNLPARISISKEDYIQTNEMIKTILEKYVPIGQTTGAKYPSAFPQLNEIEGEGLMFTLIQDIMLGKDPKETMEKADKKIKEIMGE
jgi:multiple sugar transport system substrate-binding protein